MMAEKVLKAFLYKDQFAVPGVLGSCRLRLLRCDSSSCCAVSTGLGGQHRCGLIRAVEVLNQALVEAF